MQTKDLRKLLPFLTLATLILTTLFVTPWSVTHPYSIPKLIPLVSFAFALIPVILAHFKNDKLLLQKFSVAFLLLLIHLIAAIIVLFYPQGDFFQEFYGIWGRNNGFLAYLSFIIIMFACLLYPLSNYLLLFIKITIFAGVISLIYGILQFLKLVQISKIDGNNTQSVGFFGNENFYSAFIGIVCTVAVSMALKSDMRTVTRIGLMFFVIFGMMGIYWANSQQGFLIFFIGLLVTCFVKLKTSRFKYFSKLYIISSITSLTLITLGFLQIGPLKNYLYEETLTFRGYYWRAGLKMFAENPIFGVGFDGYRDWYRRSRAKGATSRLAGNDIADSAHNYFIDIASNGGLILIITYLSVILYVIFCSIKIIGQMKEFSGPIVAVISAWYAFTTQSIFSIIQPGLTVWGWALSGLIIAIYRSPKFENAPLLQKNKSTFLNLRVMIFFTLGIIISVQPFVASSMYRKAVEEQNYILLIKAAKRFPQEANMLAAAGGALIGLGKNDEAKELLMVSINKFPNFYESWYIYSLLPNLSESEKNKIGFELRKLEPLLTRNQIVDDK